MDIKDFDGIFEAAINPDKDEISDTGRRIFGLVTLKNSN
jgi:hypothetical protein